jgi:hypothetical protein
MELQNLVYEFNTFKNDYMKKKIIISLILITTFLFFGTVFYKHFTNLCEYFNSSATGIITDLRYNTQTLVEIKLNNSKDWVYLGTNIVYDVAIEKGDSIYKKSRDYETILVKNGKSFYISSKRVITKYFKYCRCN